ncbi:hypothetical protein [Moorena sp. SIO1F2]|nr:hypothetical protein [Moorena sp. SIO1F2]
MSKTYPCKLLPIPYSLLPTPYSLFPIPDSLCYSCICRRTSLITSVGT